MPVTAKGTFAFRRVRSPSGDVLPVVFDREQSRIHAGACDWLRSLQESGSSPNTVRSYGLRVAGFLSWLPAQGLEWTQVRASTLVQWKNHLAVTPVLRAGGALGPRQPGTVAAWLVALVEFYRWAALEGLVSQALIERLTDEQFVRPGRRGGEHGHTRSPSQPSPSSEPAGREIRQCETVRRASAPCAATAAGGLGTARRAGAGDGASAAGCCSRGQRRAVVPG